VQSRIAVFCGKGGVGKTTLALALGLRQANRGRRAVVVTSHPLPELALAVSLTGLAARLPEAAKNLFVVHLDSKELLADLVRRSFTMPLLADRIIASSIYQSLVEVAPGLKEFYFLSRLQQLAERKQGLRDEPLSYDLLIWDAPATGHFLGTLRAARSFEAYLSGPLAAAGAEVGRFFSSPGRITILPVSTPEEMALQEMSEMCAELQENYQLRPATILLNMASPVLNATEGQVAAIEEDAANPALRFALGRARLERERAGQVESATGTLVTAVTRIRHTSSDIDLLESLGAQLDGLPV